MHVLHTAQSTDLRQGTFTMTTNVITVLTLVNTKSIVRNKAIKDAKFGNESCCRIPKIFGP